MLRLLAPRDDTAAGSQKISRLPFVLGLVAIIALGMGGLVVVNTQIQSRAQDLAALEQSASSMKHREAQLQAEVNQMRSASELQVRAHKLGLRPNPHPAFIILPGGQIVGTPTKVSGKELPDQVYLTWQQVQQRQEESRAKVAQERAAQRKRAAEQAAERERKRQQELAEQKKKKKHQQGNQSSGGR